LAVRSLNSKLTDEDINSSTLIYSRLQREREEVDIGFETVWMARDLN